MTFQNKILCFINTLYTYIAS